MKPIRRLLQFCADELGVASIYMLCLLPVFLVILGLGMDGAAAFRTQNLLQSTADASALAAALRLPAAGTATPTQIANAKADAFTYAKANMSVAGFGNVLNTNAAANGDLKLGNWASNTFTPDGSPLNAARVTVRTATANSNALATTFLALVGKASWDVGASAIAVNGKPIRLCVLVLGDFLSDGGGHTNLQGCSMAANGGLDCHGHNLNADFGFAVNTDNGCGNVQELNQPPVVDPYASLAASIPPNTCAGATPYPQEPAGTKWTGTQSLGATQQVCGDLQLTGDVTIASPAGGSVLVIQNGQLDLNGHNLTTSNGSALTVIFSGTTGGSYTHSITGSGTLSFAVPSSGTWANMAVYQDPALTTGVDVAFSGNGGPTWDISGVEYFPRSDLTIKGAPNSGYSGSACLILVAHNITMKGTGDLLAQGGCANQPTTLAPISILVQ